MRLLCSVLVFRFLPLYKSPKLTNRVCSLRQLHDVRKYDENVELTCCRCTTGMVIFPFFVVVYFFYNPTIAFVDKLLDANTDAKVIRILFEDDRTDIAWGTATIVVSRTTDKQNRAELNHPRALGNVIVNIAFLFLG